jgi:hypothetical protein
MARLKRVPFPSVALQSARQSQSAGCLFDIVRERMNCCNQACLRQLEGRR